MPSTSIKLDINIHREAIKKVIEQFGNEGHTIWAAEAWADTGLPMDWLKPYIQDHASGSTPKSTIFDHEGNIIKECFGVYGLYALRAIARDLGCAGSMTIGRGFEARELTSQIREKLEA